MRVPHHHVTEAAFHRLTTTHKPADGTRRVRAESVDSFFSYIKLLFLFAHQPMTCAVDGELTLQVRRPRQCTLEARYTIFVLRKRTAQGAAARRRLMPAQNSFSYIHTHIPKRCKNNRPDQMYE